MYITEFLCTKHVRFLLRSCTQKYRIRLVSDIPLQYSFNKYSQFLFQFFYPFAIKSTIAARWSSSN